jgi:hypothetical protein
MEVVKSVVPPVVVVKSVVPTVVVVNKVVPIVVVVKRVVAEVVVVNGVVAAVVVEVVVVTAGEAAACAGIITVLRIGLVHEAGRSPKAEAVPIARSNARRIGSEFIASPKSTNYQPGPIQITGMNIGILSSPFILFRSRRNDRKAGSGRTQRI